MIFSNLFKAKYKHSDPLVRIQAVDTLSPENANEKSVLHELAFNDADSRVSLAALNRLNNFDLWWKMADIAKDERIARHAKQKVESTLLGQSDIPLTESSRRTFIRECRNTTLLETLLQKKAIDESDTELMQSVLAKIGKAQLNMRVLLSTSNSDLQSLLFDGVREESDLQRLVKKSNSDELKNKAQARLNAINEAKEKPKQLNRELTLVLSKLLALSEESDYQKLVSGRKELEEVFAELQAQLNIFSEEEQTEFKQKYENISLKLNTRVTQLQPEWEAQQELERTSEALKQATETCVKVLDEVGVALTNHVEAITLGQLERFNHSIQEAESNLTAMLQANLTDAEYRGIESLINRLMSSRTSLETLPALQTAITQAKELLEQFQGLPLPDDASQIEAASLYLDEIKQRWRELIKPYEAIWPSKLQEQWQSQVKNWHKALRSIKESLMEATNSVRGRLNGVMRMVEQGRFKNAMRGYERVRDDFFALPETQQARMTRQFDKVKVQIENLKDWQAYIATPRKPEILKDIEQLVLNPLDPKQQADRVKELRREWNSLGKVESEADEAMNHAFDLACEEAFKPCREYYAELEQQRDDNYQEKLSLLEQLQKDAEQDIKVVAKALRETQQKWKNVGNVDFKVLDTLNQRYKEVINPLKAKVDVYYRENAEAKEALLKKAESLLELDNWRDATEQAKKLQENWRQIDFAGHKSENKLWTEFRKINDKIFAKREAAIAEQNQSIQDAIDDVMEKVKSASDTVRDASIRGELESVLQEVIRPGAETLSQMPKKMTQSALATLNELRRTAEEKLLYLDDSQRSQDYQKVFDVLQLWKTDAPPESVNDLSNSWRQVFLTDSLADDGIQDFTRHELTLILEGEKNIEVPAGDETLKKEVQMKLMASKLQDGIVLDSDELLKAWIQKGRIEEQDLDLLARIKSCFIG